MSNGQIVNCAIWIIAAAVLFYILLLRYYKNKKKLSETERKISELQRELEKCDSEETIKTDTAGELSYGEEFDDDESGGIKENRKDTQIPPKPEQPAYFLFCENELKDYWRCPICCAENNIYHDPVFCTVCGEKREL